MPMHIAITRRVRPGCEAEFQRALQEFFQASFAHSGVLSASMLTPPPGSDSREYGILRTFANASERDDFYKSPMFKAWEERAGQLTEGEPLFFETNSGWFSDRSAAYLASGRPVVLQDTGFSAHLPCGDGLFAVRTPDDAAAALDEITANYRRHSHAAREIAAEYLDASKTLPTFLRECGV